MMQLEFEVVLQETYNLLLQKLNKEKKKDESAHIIPT